MIPLRIYLKGFMSFRDAAEMQFDGGSLWMLTGHNGAGKSAIFDAILYALFGIHRRGTQNAHFIINKQSKGGLEVEFDFSVGNRVFRVRRTLTGTGRPGVQAFECVDALNGDRSRSSWEVIGETNSRDKLREWVVRTIGMDERAFTSSVFLQQGKSEKLLTAEDKERHETLSQIIDLSAYQRLYERADERRKSHKIQADVLQSQLNTIAQVNETEIDMLEQQATAAKSIVDETRAQLDEIIGLKIHAQNWNRLQVEFEEVQQEVKSGESLLAKSKQIELDAMRLSSLQRALPLLREILNGRQRLAIIEQQIREHNLEVVRYAAAKSAIIVELNKAQENCDAVVREREELRVALDAAQDTLAQLAPHRVEIGRLHQCHDNIAQLDLKFSQIPSGLDEQILELEESLKALNELRSSLPLLQNFVEARSGWNAAKEQIEKAVSTISHLTDALAVSEKSGEECRLALANAEERLALAERRNTEAQLLLTQTEERLKRLTQLEGQPKCEWCGQDLTPEHLEAEERRVREANREAFAKLKSAEENHRIVLSDVQALQESLKQSTKDEEDLRRKLERAKTTLDLNRQQQEQRLQQASAAVSTLSVDYPSHVQWGSVDDVVQCLSSSFPDDKELSRRLSETKNIGSVENRLAGLRKQESERDGIVAHKNLELANIAAIEERYPIARQNEIEQIESTTTRQLNKLRESCATVDNQVEIATNSLKKIIKNANETEDWLQRTKHDADLAIVRQQELCTSISARETALDDSWREVGRSFTESDLDTWTHEEASLADAGERLRQLRAAGEHQAIRRSRLTEIQREIEGIEPNARCNLAELEEREAAVGKLHKENQKIRTDAENKKRVLEEQLKLRRELEKQRLGHAQNGELFRQLAQLLGKDNLQRHLLSQAESNIVRNANDVLDRISSGTLRLELSRAVQAGASKSGSKALDLLANFSGTGVDALPVDFLSGSQRFRVAVSLALGIGQYASNGSRRIESVILDEGFGSLDKQGCSEMIAELQHLQNVLGRIILVTHQEEVADAFPNNKYLVQIVGGTSRVSLVEI